MTQLDMLSPYQLRVLQLMAEGRSNIAIAAQLGVSRRAIENQVSRLMQALGLARDNDAIAARVCAVLIYLSACEAASRPDDRTAGGDLVGAEARLGVHRAVVGHRDPDPVQPLKIAAPGDDPPFEGAAELADPAELGRQAVALAV